MLTIPTAHELTVQAASPLEPQEALYFFFLTYVVVSTPQDL